MYNRLLSKPKTLTMNIKQLAFIHYSHYTSAVIPAQAGIQCEWIMCVSMVSKEVYYLTDYLGKMIEFISEQ